MSAITHRFYSNQYNLSANQLHKTEEKLQKPEFANNFLASRVHFLAASVLSGLSSVLNLGLVALKTVLGAVKISAYVITYPFGAKSLFGSEVSCGSVRGHALNVAKFAAAFLIGVPATVINPALGLDFNAWIGLIAKTPATAASTAGANPSATTASTLPVVDPSPASSSSSAPVSVAPSVEGVVTAVEEKKEEKKAAVSHPSPAPIATSTAASTTTSTAT